MFTKNNVSTRISVIQTKMDEKKVLAKNGIIDTMSGVEFQIMCREINIDVITTVIGADLTINKKGEYRVKNIFGHMPSTSQLLQIRRLQDDFYKEVTCSYVTPTVKNDDELETRPPQNTKTTVLGKNFVRPEKLTNKSFVETLTVAINKKLTGDDIHEIAAMAEELRTHNAWSWAIKGIIVIGLIGGGIFLVKSIMDDKDDNNETTTDNNESFNEMNDITVDLDENPEISLDSSETVPEELGKF